MLSGCGRCCHLLCHQCKKHLDKRCCCTIGHLVVHESMMGMVLQYSTLDVSRWTRAFHEITFDEEGWLDVKSMGKSSFSIIPMRTVKEDYYYKIWLCNDGGKPHFHLAISSQMRTRAYRVTNEQVRETEDSYKNCKLLVVGVSPEHNSYCSFFLNDSTS